MPRNMSFSITPRQYQAQTKTVTRRLGWWNVQPGDVLNGVEKARGLKRGEKVKRLGQHRVLNKRFEPLRRMIDEPEYGRAECVLEGFPDWTPEQFVAMFCETHGCPPEIEINRIEYEYL